MNHPSLILSTTLLAFSLTACNGGSSSSSDAENPETDLEAPVIRLVGESDTTVIRGDAFTDPGASASDDVDGDLTAQIQVTGDVNTDQVGRYPLRYSVSDIAGNTSEVTRQVYVLPVERMPILNDTGSTVGGNYPTGNNADCIGETIDQQDCSYGRDSFPILKIGGRLELGSSSQGGDKNGERVAGGNAGFDFTKLGSDGRPLTIQTASYSEDGTEEAGTKWACVRDNHTGLIWEVKNQVPAETDLHSYRDTYTYFNSDPDTNAGHSGVELSDDARCTGFVAGQSDTYCNTERFVERVNTEGFCGAFDWRLPNMNELFSLVDVGSKLGGIDRAFFPTLAPDFVNVDKSFNDEVDYSQPLRTIGYLISSNYGGSETNTRILYTGSGATGSSPGETSHHAMLVRSQIPVTIDVSGPMVTNFDATRNDEVAAENDSGEPLTFSLSTINPYELSADEIGFEPSVVGTYTKNYQILRDGVVVEDRVLTVHWE